LIFQFIGDFVFLFGKILYSSLGKFSIPARGWELLLLLILYSCSWLGITFVIPLWELFVFLLVAGNCFCYSSLGIDCIPARGWEILLFYFKFIINI